MRTTPPGARLQALAVLLVAACTVVPIAPAAAQTGEMPVVTTTLAIRNATVVPAPGQVLEGATVVIRDGVITAVGADIAIPYDAKIIDADSMWVYAGFVDALSNAALEAPRPQAGGQFGGGGGQQPNVSRANPPPAVAGIEPYKDVRADLKPSDGSVSGLRNAGFTAAHTVPYGRMMPGQGAVILLHGETASDMVVAGGTSIFIQFQGARGVYPGTPMAMMAKLRQVYRESARRLDHKKMYDADPSGMPRPAYDPVHAAFYPIVEGDTPIYFFVDDALEAHRALTLREELGFRMVLTGLNEGHDLAEKLSRSGVPLAVTLALPDKPEWLKAVKRDSMEQMIADYDPDMRLATYADLEAGLRNLKSRQARSREAYVSNAAQLSDVGVSFAFTSAGAKASDVHSNLREMIAAGLSEDAALAGLTTTAAEVIGMSRSMGSIEVGKMGNLVVASGPLFDEKTKLRHTVIEGLVYDIEEPSAGRGGGGGPAGSIAGTWSSVAIGPDGPIGGTIVFEGQPGSWSAVVRYDGVDMDIPVSTVDVDGDSVSFSFVGPDGAVSVSLTNNGGTMEGTASTPDADVPVTLTRRGPSQR